MTGKGAVVQISAEARAIGQTFVESVFEDLDNLSINDDESQPVTAAAAGPTWGEAQIMAMEGEEAGRMRYVSVPPSAAEPTLGPDAEE